MDRTTVYSGQIPLETDLLYTNRRVAIETGMGWLALLGSSTYVSGLACNPTSPASLQVTVGAGSIFSYGAVDATAYSSLAADTTHQIQRQGVLLDAVTLTLTPPGTTGQSTNFLVQASYADTDGTPVVLPYYNASNPSVAWSGPNNTGTPQNTVRQGKCVISLKAGTPAATGSQTTPAPDSGNVGLYVITVANGASTVTAGNISTYTSAPFISETLTQKISQATGDARYAQLGNANSWSGSQTFASPISINGAAGTNRQIFIQSGGSTRWSIYADTSAESGGNAGSTFEIGRYSDAGTYLDSPMAIARATGMVTFNDGLTVNGGITGALSGNVTGNCSGSSGSCTGNAATATKLATTRSIALSGAVTGSANFDGSAGITIATSQPNSSANTIRGNNTGSPAAPTDLTPSQVLTLLGAAGVIPGTTQGNWSVTIPTPSGNLIIQGGYYAGPVTTNTSYPMSWGSAFPTVCIWAGAFCDLNGASGNVPYSIVTTAALTTTGTSFSPRGYQSGGTGNATGFYWIAVGK